MPMTFTPEMVERRLSSINLQVSDDEITNRERLARWTEERIGDFVEAWEIRTGRGWDQMTPAEARSLLERHPSLYGNPGVLSRLFKAEVS